MSDNVLLCKLDDICIIYDQDDTGIISKSVMTHLSSTILVLIRVTLIIKGKHGAKSLAYVNISATTNTFEQ